jgi:hypothetical protein
VRVNTVSTYCNEWGYRAEGAEYADPLVLVSAEGLPKGCRRVAEGYEDKMGWMHQGTTPVRLTSN